MSLTGRTLTAIWKTLSGFCEKSFARPGIVDPRNTDYETYSVECPQTAKQIREWALQKTHAEKAIDDYLTAEFSTKVLGVDGPVYKLDDTGHIECVRLRGWMNFSLPGWEARDMHSNWLVPIRPQINLNHEKLKDAYKKEGNGKDKKEDKATQYMKEQTLLGQKKRDDLQALPAVPSYETLKELLNWPDMQPQSWEEEAADKEFITYAHATDRLLIPFGFGDHVFIEIPAASSFDEHPSIQEKITNWVAPNFLKPISREEIETLKNQFEQKCQEEKQKSFLQP